MKHFKVVFHVWNIKHAGCDKIRSISGKTLLHIKLKWKVIRVKISYIFKIDFIIP